MKCTCYGYLPSRNCTRALGVQEWECSSDKVENVRTNPNMLSTPDKLSRAFSCRLYLKRSFRRIGSFSAGCRDTVKAYKL